MKVLLKILTSAARLCDRYWSGTSAARHALDSIMIERESSTRMVAVATNGSAMLAISWPEPVTAAEHETFVGLVPRKLIDAIIEALKPARHRHADVGRHDTCPATVSVAVDGDHVHLTARYFAPDAKFPRWRNYYQNKASEAAVTVAVDPRRLADLLLAVADAATSDDRRAVALTVDPTSQPGVLVRAADGSGVTAAGLLNVRPSSDLDSEQWTPRAEEGAEATA